MNKEQLIKTLSVQSESYQQWRMFAHIIRQTKEIDCNFFIEDGSIYITKGEADIYPCIVAHMDTVHDIVSDLSVISSGNKLTGFNAHTMQQTGIGGDDKVGIFIAMECLKHFDNIKVVFFRDEEIGCDGSYNAYMDFFTDCSFVLQCDRKGNSDFVTTASGVHLSGNDFQNDVLPIIKRYGYKFEHGLMTDVMALKENGLKCCAANISCGYYRPHSHDEYVNIDDVDNCLDMVKEIIAYLGDTRYKHKYKRRKVQLDKFKSFDDYDYYGKLFKEDYSIVSPIKKPEYCDCCCETVKHTTYVSIYNMEVCDKCITNYIPELLK